MWPWKKGLEDKKEAARMEKIGGQLTYSRVLSDGHPLFIHRELLEGTLFFAKSPGAL